MENERPLSANYKKKPKSAGSVVAGLLFSHVGLFFVVAAYACAGAQIFVMLEHPTEMEAYADKQAAADQVDEAMQFVSNLFWQFKKADNVSYSAYYNETYYRMRMLEVYIIDKVNNYNYDGTRDGWDTSWHFFNCLLLTISIMTTIGYGHISPNTFWGQLFCIVYAIVGCPLLLVFLANIGDAMANTLVYLYSRWACRWCRTKRYDSELPPEASKRQLKLLIDDEIGEEEFMPTSKVVVPITLCMVILSGYIMLGAYLFHIWENWSVSSACYFTFITISTIGYGDLVPGNALGEATDIGAMLKMLVAVFYILVGMALLSMCINLMQEQLIEKCRWLANEVGMTSNKSEVKEAPKDTKDDLPDDTFRVTSATKTKPTAIEPIPGALDNINLD